MWMTLIISQYQTSISNRAVTKTFIDDCFIWILSYYLIVIKMGCVCLQGHVGEVFVVEPHPQDIRVLLSAG